METLRKVVAGLVAITACLLYAHASHAVAPMQKGQAFLANPLETRTR